MELPKLSLPAAMPRLARVGLRYNTAWERLMSGSIRGERVGGRWYIAVAEVERLEREAEDASEYEPARRAARALGMSFEGLLVHHAYGRVDIRPVGGRLMVRKLDVARLKQERATRSA